LDALFLVLEFDRLLKKHGTETGLPVVVDFYSDSCGPCRMMAPIFKKVAKEFADTAVFVKVDTNAQHELSGRYQIRSLPTFQWFVGGKKSNEAKGGIGEGPLRQMTQQAVTQAQIANVQLSLEALVEFYQQVDPSKPQAEIESVYQKCVGKNNKSCQGSTASSLVRKLKKKYQQAPQTTKLWVGEVKKESGGDDESAGKAKPREKNASASSSNKAPNLQFATIDELKIELEKRLDEERDAQLEEETDEDEEAMDYHYRWSGPGDFPERVTIIGGGPAGLAAAVYAARAGLTPLVLAPSMGGQLQGKGVDVENYPGLSNVTGPAVIAAMRQQAAHFGAVFEEDWVVGLDTSSRPLKVLTNSTGAIETHSIIVATGADSRWLGVEGEYEMRGGGVSSCATCDGFLYAQKRVVVVGGGDAAMEDALVLARTSEKVTLVHRRDAFRASKVLADRVQNHPSISIEWNTIVEKITGQVMEDDSNDENIDLDNEPKVVTGVVLKDAVSGETRQLACDAVFVAIGHLPNTNFLEGVVEFDPEHAGYLKTTGRSTKTTVAGIFAAGDVSDAVYRQAITSAGSGAAAALDAERWLSEEGLGNEAAELEAELMAELMVDEASAQRQDDLGYNAYEDAGGRMQGMRESVRAEL
jgi:thioredoxin reductase (NADPH)